MTNELGKLVQRIAQSTGAFGVSPREIDRRSVTERSSARLTNLLDAETRAFEAELLQRPVELPVFQRHAWLEHVQSEFLLFQLRDAEGKAAMQAVISVERPQRLPSFGRALACKLGPASSAVDEEIGLHAMKTLCAESDDLVSLRLQPYRRSYRALLDFEAHARRVGYGLVDPIGVTRTLVYDLSATLDEQIAALSKKTRAKVRHRERQNVTIRPITDTRFVARCTEAVNASLARTGGGTTRYNFRAAFALAESHPTEVRVLGFFRNERPDELLAYVVGVRHGELAEYSSAGSMSDPALRSVPFNYWLLWELICWAKEGGAQWLDLGGITDGGPSDRRAGISGFKRHFSDLDVELGRELLVPLRPLRALALDAMLDWRNRRAKVKGDSPQEDEG